MSAEVRERPAARRRGVFHPLTVSAVDRLTDDAVAVTFDVPLELAGDFRFVQGQHITIRCELDGRELRRNYSICSPAPDGPLRVAVKRLDGGGFSAYVNEYLRPGDTLDVMPPLGGFHVPLRPERARRHVAIAAGSGITPVLSLLTTTLAAEPASAFTLVYGNRTARDVMFLEELQDTKDRYPDRFELLNVLSREVGEAPICSGRIDAGKLDALFTSLVRPDEVDQWYLCGPFDLVRTVREALRERSVPDERVRFELFHADDAPDGSGGTATAPGTTGSAPRRHPRQEGGEAGATSTVEFTLAGRTSTVEVPTGGTGTESVAAGSAGTGAAVGGGTAAGETVLSAALRVRGDAPYACRGGVCGTCRAKLREGEVDMARNYALEPTELSAGYILTCQSRPLTDRVVVDYDA